MKSTLSRDKSDGFSTRTLVFLALFAVFAMMLSYLEGMLPQFLPIPGFKPGFANAVVTAALVFYGFGGGAVVSLLRIFLTGILFSTPTQFLFSLGGGALSLLVSAAAIRFGRDRLSYFGVSVLSAASHNLGQMLVACLYFGDGAIFGYLPWLLMISLVTGSVTGALMQVLCPRLYSIFKKGLPHA